MDTRSMTGGNPEWFHRTLKLELAKDVWYEFRTLSLYDVYVIWPSVKPAMKALQDHQPITFARYFLEILKVIQPTLAAVDEHVELLRSSHTHALVEFYKAQDWMSIVRLGGYLEQDGGDAQIAEDPDREVVDRDTAHQRFLAICCQAAKMANTPVQEFMKERFEYGVTVILVLKQAFDDRERAETSDRMPAAKFFELMDAVLPHQKVGAEKPAWMLEIEAMTPKSGAN